MKPALFRSLIAGLVLTCSVGCTDTASQGTTTVDTAVAIDAEDPLAPTVEWLRSVGAKNGNRDYTTADLKKVISLRLAVNQKVDDAALAEHVAKLTSLQSLNLDATRVTDAGLAHLAPLTNLRRLDLGSLKGITGEGMAHLAALSELESLSLQQSGIVDRDLARVADALPHLRKLSLAWLPVDSGLEYLEELEHLEDLDLFHAKVTDAGAAHLAKLTGLKKLLLWHTEITDRGLASIAGLEDLETLYLEGTRVTDTGMAHLSKLAKLSYLWIPDLPITDRGLANLANCEALRTIHAPKTKITPKGIAELVKSIPGVKVTVH